MQIIYLWLIVFINVLHGARPDLGQEYGSLTLSFQDPAGDVDIGSTIFNNMFWSSKSHIVYRYCPFCVATHQHIYYKRLTDLAAVDLYSIIYLWTDTNNLRGDDFNLYSSADDALNDINPWTYCDYNDNNVGFPRNCGPNGFVGCSFVSRNAAYDQGNPGGCSKEGYFYIYRGTLRQFTFFAAGTPWPQASTNCHDQGMAMGTVKDDHDIQALAKALIAAGAYTGAGVSTHMWIGLNHMAVADNERWEWDDGEQCENKEGSGIFVSTNLRPYHSGFCMNFWGTTEPNSASEPCAALWLKQDDTYNTLYEWHHTNDAGSYLAYPYVCSTIVSGAVDCVEGSTYTEWTDCNALCGVDGQETRDRLGDIPAENGGVECSSELQTQTCTGPLCPINCIEGDWDPWTDCNAACDFDGTQTRNRVGDSAPENGGAECSSNVETQSCSGPPCCPNGVGTFDWNTMTEEGKDVPEYSNLTFYVDDQDLTLNIQVELKYLGKTTANHQKDSNYGTTYVLDFEDFNAHKDAIYEPGTCQNRMKSSFYNGATMKDFVNDFWEYSTSPQNPDGIGTDSTLAYPPGNGWTLSMKDDACDTIVYNRKFTWSELRGCNNNNPNNKITYTNLIYDDIKKQYKLTGTFYINVVSPFAYQSDFGYYRVYQLLSKPFAIIVSSTIQVLGSTGIDLIQMYIIAVYKEDRENTDIFRLVVMTEAAEYLELQGASLLEFAPDDNTNAMETSSFETPVLESGCLDNRNYICTQLWNIDSENTGCDLDQKLGTDFSGNYKLSFSTNCKSGLGLQIETRCADFLNDHVVDNTVMLDTDLKWKDNICQVEEFELQFDAQMLFYTDDTFTEDKKVGDEYLFQAGVDTINVKIDTTFPDDTFEVFNTVLQNVYICTFPYTFTPPTFADVLNGNSPLDEMGCLNAARDDSLASIVNTIYPIPTNDIVDFVLYPDDDGSDTIRFSFLIPEQVTRDTLYIHAQIEVELQEPITGRRIRRRMLLDVNTANQISHFGKEVGITHNNNNNPQIPNQPQQPLPYYNPNPSSTINLSLKSPFVIVIGSLLSLILTINICYMCYVNFLKDTCQKRRRKRKGYESVKRIDSEFDSEAQMLDNQE